MKATGIVRRIDDLGRVVIPLEIRKNIGIAGGDPLEIFVESDRVIFAKYRPNLQSEVSLLEDRVIERYDNDKVKKITCLLSKVQEELAHLENEG